MSLLGSDYLLDLELSAAQTETRADIISSPSIITAMDDPLLFSHPSIGHPFTNKSWDNWKTVLKAGDGLPMTTAETEFFKSISGGREPPSVRGP